MWLFSCHWLPGHVRSHRTDAAKRKVSILSRVQICSECYARGPFTSVLLYANDALCCVHGDRDLVTTMILSRTDYNVTDSGRYSYDYDFNLCAPIQTNACKDSSAMICQVLFDP